MRATFLLVGGLALFLGGCSGGKVSHAPPPLNKELLSGKWKNSSEVELIAGFDFAEDGAVKMTVLGMKQPVPGRYTWSGERTLDVEYQAAADIQQAYEAAAKAYKDQVMDRIKTGKLYAQAGPSMLATVADKLPAKETFTVGISDPRVLILVREGGSSLTFEKAD